MTTENIHLNPDDREEGATSAPRDRELALLVRCLSAIALFSLWPVLHYANHNREQLDSGGYSVLTITFFASFLAGSVAFSFLHLASRRKRTIASAATVATFIVLFFHYHAIYGGIVDIFSTVGLSQGENHVYLGLVALLCGLSFILLNTASVLTSLLVFGAVVNLIPGTALTMFALSVGTDGASSRDHEPLTSRFVDTPNIYHLITDGYARHDTMSLVTGLDNTAFLTELERRGFYVAGRSYANYPSTFLSISSTMNMEYMVTEDTKPFETRRRFYDVIQGNNLAVTHLQNQGYRYIHQGATQWDGSKCSGREDLCLSTEKTIRRAILNLTPLRRFIKTEQPSTIADLDRRLSRGFEVEAPIYVFAHTFPPHPPRTFTSTCGPVWTEADERTVDAAEPPTGLISDPRFGPLDFWGDRRGYANDVQCTNAQILSLIDRVLSRNPETVILLHSDHGSAFGVDWDLPLEEWPESQFEERFAILMALKLPSRCREFVYPTISPVNVYPLLFACLANEQPKLFPDISFVAPKEKHPQYGTAYAHRPVSAHTEEKSTKENAKP